MLLAEGRLPECWIPPARILECRALLETYHDLRAEHTAWAQRIPAVLFHRGAPAPGEGTLRTEQGLAALRAAAAECLTRPPGSQNPAAIKGQGADSAMPQTRAPMTVKPRNRTLAVTGRCR